MTTSSLQSPVATEALERKIDALTEQVAQLAAEARLRAMRQEMYGELLHDLSPLATEAMAVAARELEAMSRTGDLSEVIGLLRTVVEVAPRLERALVMVDALADLADVVVPMSSEAVAVVTDVLAAHQQKGSFEFVKAGLGVVDRIVTGFSEEDVAALGDNIVTILETVKEITQPELLVLLQRMIGALQRQQQEIEDEGSVAPGLWALLRKMRDPDVRRGIDRALTTLGSVSAETGPEMKQIHRTAEQGDK